MAEDKQFPILTWGRLQIGSIPWGMIGPHEAQAQRNHSQSLATLASRGGLCYSEAIAVLTDRRWEEIPNEVAQSRLAEMIRAYNDRG